MSLIEKFVTQWLPEASLEFLNILCGEFKIVVPPQKAGKHQEILKLVLRYLSGEELENSDDQGAAVFAKLFQELGMELGKGQPKAEPGVQEGGAPASTFNVTKLRELKITGTIDGGKEGTLSYTSLSCQLKQAEAAGYSTTEMIAAVIKAIPTGKSFRSLLESKIDSPKDDFYKLLRSHYKEKDSAAVLQLLLNCFQEPGQDAHEFCCLAMSLRDRVQALSEEEGNPEDEEVLNKRLYHTIFTGLKQNSIRMELHNDIKNADLSDVEFLDKVSIAEANEIERLGKVKLKAEISSLTENSVGKKPSTPSSAAPKPKSAAAEPANKNYDKKFDLLISKVDSLTTLSQEQASKIAVLETKLAGQNAGQNPYINIPQNAGHGAGFGANAGTGQRSYVNTQHTGSGMGAGNSNVNTGIGNGTTGLGNGNTGPNQGSNRRVFKCGACQANRVGYCSHCFKCGSELHKVKDCPEN